MTLHDFPKLSLLKSKKGVIVAYLSSGLVHGSGTQQVKINLKDIQLAGTAVPKSFLRTQFNQNANTVGI